MVREANIICFGHTRHEKHMKHTKHMKKKVKFTG